MWDNLPKHVREPNPDVYRSDNFVCVDFEITSSNDDYGDHRNVDNKILVAAWYCGTDHARHSATCYSSTSGEFNLQHLVQDVASAEFVVAHNTKYELGWLSRAGVEPGSVVSYCTQIGERVLSGNRMWGKQSSLADCLGRREMGGKDFVGRLIRQGIPTEDIPTRWLEHYCIDDVIKTVSLFYSQRSSIYNRRLAECTYTRNLLTPVLAAIERNGLCVDKDRARILYEKYNNKLIEYQSSLAEITGGINFRSPKQIAEFVYGTGKGKLGFKRLRGKNGRLEATSGGNPRTDKATLERLVASTSKQREFLRVYKEINKYDHSVTKILRKFYNCSTETADSILFGNIGQTVADTGRLNSTGATYRINFQNINREFKPVICCRNRGWKFVELDQAQLEFRVGVYLGQDKQGMEDIQNKVDVHSFSAANLFSEDWVREGGSLTEFTNDCKPKTKKGRALRQSAKAETFKPLYGGKSGSDQQVAYYQAFRERYRGIASTQERWFNKVATDKWMRIPSGLIFYWPNAVFNRGELPHRVVHQICNYPVQSLATADIVPISLVYLYYRTVVEGCRCILVNTIHDSVLAEVHPDDVEKYIKIAKECFEVDVVEYMRRVYKIDFNVPLEAEETVGSHWSNSKEWEEEYLGEN